MQLFKNETIKSFSLITMGALVFFVFGLVFAGILTSPSIINELNIGIEKATILLIVFYNFGKFSAGIVDKNIRWATHLPIITISSFISMMGFLLLGSKYNLYIYGLVAFIFGICYVFASIALRDTLTRSMDIKIKRIYNAMSTVGWSTGVGLFSVLSQKHSYFILVAISITPIMLLLELITLTDVNPIKKINSDSLIIESDKAWLLKLSSTLKILIIGILLYSVIISSLNSSIVNHVKEIYSLSSSHLSFVLMVPIIGSFLSLLISSSVFKGISTVSQYLIFKGLSAIAIISLFITTNFYIFLILLALVGFFTNEETALSYQIIAEESEVNERRRYHATAEVIGVVGAPLAWILRYTFNDIQSILSILFLLFVGLLVWHLYLSELKEPIRVKINDTTNPQ